MKTSTYVLSILALLALGMGEMLQAQVVTTLPRPSQAAQVSQTIGLSKITIDYHRPAVKEREVWGKLVPYGQVWRAGANENTVISFSHDVEIEGKPLAKGEYGLHMIPGEQAWTLIFSSETRDWGSFSYSPANDALRVTTQARAVQDQYEFLTFTFNKVEAQSAEVALRWDKKEIPFEVSFAVPELVVADLKEQLLSQSGWTWQGWYEAANYAYNNNINLEEASTWVGRSVVMNPNLRNISLKAKFAAKQENILQDQLNEYLLSAIGKEFKTQSVDWRTLAQGSALALKLNNPVKAMEWATQAHKMSPNFVSLQAKANVLKAQNKEKEAEKMMGEAVQKGNINELNQYGYQLLATGQTAKAVEVFELNAKKHPEDANVHDSLGEGYLNNGQNEKAIAAFKKSLSLNPPPPTKANSLKLLKKLGVNYSEEGESSSQK